MAKGAFIVIEGSNGSGKATQVALLAIRLRKEGYSVETINFPQKDEPSSYFVKEYLDNSYGGPAKVNPYTASLFYTLDRYQASIGIRKALDNGVIVIADRYTASNMAYQGSKFTHPDERRGYFIWIDSIEYQTFGIPRPDKTIVLHATNDVSSRVVNKRLERAGTPTTSQVYDEICDLFPNDFLRLDCFRSGKLIDKDSVHTMVWNAVKPLISEKPQSAAVQTSYLQSSTKDYIKPNTVQAPILDTLKAGFSPQLPAIPEFYIPKIADSILRNEYSRVFTQVTSLRQIVLEKLAAYGRLTSGLSKIDITVVDNLLPYATLVATPEVVSSKVVTTNEFLSLASKYLPDNHAKLSDQPQLVSHWPKNEFDLLPEMLYKHGNTPISDIRASVATWPVQRKQEALQTYIEHVASPDILNKYCYDWDILASYSSMSALSAVGAKITHQELTPRYGYEVPKIIEEADAIEEYERCFDLSLVLHSQLQSAGLYNEAQFAVLLGHKQRFIASTTAAMPLPNGSVALSDMTEKLLETHPVLYETISIKSLDTASK